MPETKRQITGESPIWGATESPGRKTGRKAVKKTGTKIRKSANPKTGLFLYDGDCDFCIRSAEWLKVRLGPGSRIRPFDKKDTQDHGLTAEDLNGSAWWIADDTTADGPTKSYSAKNSMQNSGKNGSETRPGHTASPGGIASPGHIAISLALKTSRSRFWRLTGKIFLLTPFRQIGGAIYRMVARNRHRF